LNTSFLQDYVCVLWFPGDPIHNNWTLPLAPLKLKAHRNSKLQEVAMGSKLTPIFFLASLTMGRCTQHRACWRQVDRSYLKGEKGFLATSWRGSL